jgi:hypothetical protein
MRRDWGRRGAITKARTVPAYLGPPIKAQVIVLHAHKAIAPSTHRFPISFNLPFFVTQPATE